jgi:hypothetical protein
MANISTPITLLQVSNLDAKLCNWYVSGANIVVETIPEYLARVTINRRSPATLVAILMPKDGYTSLSPYSYASFKDILTNYDCKLYYFKEGLYDEDFVEFTLGEYVDDVYVVADEQFPIVYLKYTKGGVEYAVTDIPKANGIIVGGIVSWMDNLNFVISPSAYYINGELYTVSTETVTLSAADATHSRIDIIVVDTLGQVVVVEGVAAANPQKPTPDPETQIELTQILVPAGATEPGGTITNTIIYDENIEWTGSSVGVTVDFNSAVAPFRGVVCADVGSITDNNTIVFTGAAPISVSDFDNFVMSLNLKEALTNRQSIRLRFYSDTTLVSSETILNFDKTIIGSWQNITIPLNTISFSSGTFNKIQFQWIRSGGAVSSNLGFYLDYIKVESGLQQAIFNNGIELTGDVSGSGITGTPVPTTLATVLATPGTYGDASNIPQFTVDAKGRIIAVSNVPVSISDSTFDISIYFEEAADEYVYHCPFDMKITAYEYEDGVATFSPDFVLGEIVLNKYDTLTITSTTIGLIILKGELL